MARAQLNGPMEGSTKVSMSMIRSMGLGFSTGPMAGNTMDLGKTGSSTAEESTT